MARESHSPATAKNILVIETRARPHERVALSKQPRVYATIV